MQIFLGYETSEMVWLWNGGCETPSLWNAGRETPAVKRRVPLNPPSGEWRSMDTAICYPLSLFHFVGGEWAVGSGLSMDVA